MGTCCVESHARRNAEQRAKTTPGFSCSFTSISFAAGITAQPMALALCTSHPLHHANTSLQPSLKREILTPKLSPQDTQGTISRLLPFPLHSGLAHRPQPQHPVHVQQHCNGAGLCSPGALLHRAHHCAAQPRPMLSLVLIYPRREEAGNDPLMFP